MLKFFVSCTFLYILISLCSVLALDERSAMEKRCSKTLPKPTENIDVNWGESKYMPILKFNSTIQSTGNWFYSHGNRLQFYRFAAEVSQMSIDEINEDDLYYRGCMKLEWDGGDSPVIHGFRGKTSAAPVQQVNPGVLRVNLPNLKTDATAVLTLTDNKSFIFIYGCYDDGEASWAVISTVDDLDKKTEKLIHEHAKSLGFNEKYFTEMEFEQCEESNAPRVEL